MEEASHNLVANYMRTGQFNEALNILAREAKKEPKNWNIWFVAGQCLRFMGRFDDAIKNYEKAIDLNKYEKSIYLALGIAHQHTRNWSQAIDAFRNALELDGDYALAFNSLALTQKKMGELEKASHNYHAGVLALYRCIVKGMKNSRESPIYKHMDTQGTLWMEYAMEICIYLCSLDPSVSSMAFPTAEIAIEEEMRETHGGLYWVDCQDKQGQKNRLFLPNYFNTLRETLKLEPAYANLIGNRGMVLEMLGQYEEADQHIAEAQEFSS